MPGISAELNMGINLNAYDLKQEDYMEELKSFGMVLEHKKTGARIAVIKNDDPNKVFSIGFRTPPADSTGVAHIIEHSVLCGSQQFPVKDPFIELVKGSLNTFLNAMTYSDKTLYPIASCNDKDYQNLMHVYLDAVFYPEIYRKKEIFMQEGWHYELERPDSALMYNGVVYNEMKGVFSSPEQILFRTIQSSLFPDTPYGTESGGIPEFIPDLSYEGFLEFHRKFYHPSNSYIYMYGNMDVEEKLNWMDNNYLSRFDRLEVNSQIALQKPFTKVKEVTEYYSLSEEEGESDKTYISYNVVVGTSLDPKLSMAFQILEQTLLSAPGAPLKQALLDAGIGNDILSDYDNGIRQPVFSIIAKDTEEDKKKEFVRIITDVLEKTIKEGLDEKSVRAAINNLEFKYREADYGSYPKGLMYGIQILDSWLYDDSKPFIHIRANETFEFLKKQIGTGYFEGLIKEYLLNNTHGTIVIVKPKKNLTSEMEEKTAKRLEEYKNNLSIGQIEAIVEETRNLKRYQEEPSPQEDMEKIPMLSRVDIAKECQPFYNDRRAINGTEAVHHNIYTNGIGYYKLAFAIDDLTGYAPYLSLLSDILGYMDTEHYRFLDFSNEVNIYTGGIFTDINIYNKYGSDREFRTFFEVRVKVLYENIPRAFELIEEMLLHTKPDDEKRIHEIIMESRSKMQMKLNSSGHMMAAARAMGYFSKSASLGDQQSGIGYYKFLDELESNFSDRKQELFTELSLLMRHIFRRDRLIVSVTADEKGYADGERAIIPLLDRLQKEAPAARTLPAREIPSVSEPLNEGFKTSGQVQYVARAGNYLKNGGAFHGSLRVLKVILSYDYLWINVRVKGGAYGCMCGFSYNGDGYLVSYRDPELGKTNGIFEGAAEYVKNFTAEDRDMTKYVIGAISSLDTPLNPSAKGSRSFMAYLTGITREDVQRERNEVLQTETQDIRRLSDHIESLINADCICVIGNEQKLEGSKELFRNIRNLL